MILSTAISELAGIHAGDGYLRYHGKRKELDISGCYDEKEYYDYHITSLFKKAFDTNIDCRYFPKRRTYGFVVRDRKILTIFANLGFPSGSKSLTVACPSQIINSSKKHHKAFLRGYFDTDGCLTFDKKIYNKNPFKKTRNFYPKIMFSTVSNQLAEDVISMTKQLGFRPTCSISNSGNINEHPQFRIQIAGIFQMNKWLDQVGSMNPSKISRYHIWDQFGHCPPNTTYSQRTQILKGKLDPNSFYGPVA